MSESRMTEYDMQQVVIKKKLPKTGNLTSDQALSAALKAGVKVETEKKFAAGGNKQHQSTMNSLTLDSNELDDLHVPQVSLDVARAIQQARQAMNPPMTQKDLAQRISEKPQVINDFEAGKAIPNQQILGKLERVLNVKLRGKNIGQSCGPKKG